MRHANLDAHELPDDGRIVERADIMTLELHLSPEIETRLFAQAALTGRAPEALALEALEEKLSDQAAVRPDQGPAEWRAQLAAWIGLHPIVDHFVDDSRDSIYEGRGE
jgi:hypothetical protein